MSRMLDIGAASDLECRRKPLRNWSATQIVVAKTDTVSATQREDSTRGRLDVEVIGRSTREGNAGGWGVVVPYIPTE